MDFVSSENSIERYYGTKTPENGEIGLRMTSIGRPHKVMTWLEYIDFGFKGPHIVEHIQDGTGNVAYWPIGPILSVEFDRGKEVGLAEKYDPSGRWEDWPDPPLKRQGSK